LSTLHPGLTDATVVSARYCKDFMRRNNSSSGLIVFNNQSLDLLLARIFCNAKISFKVFPRDIAHAAAAIDAGGRF